jgi:NhaC family Na+:H+ antiporter
MFEFTVFALFALSLVTCVATGHSILYALVTGFLLFFFYGLRKGFSARNLLGMAASSARKVLVIALVMLLIGALTASWRAAGTIAFLVSYATQYIGAHYALLAAFLLNGALSTLIGTSFGTVATMGVITMTLLSTSATAARRCPRARFLSAPLPQPISTAILCSCCVRDSFPLS